MSEREPMDVLVLLRQERVQIGTVMVRTTSLTEALETAYALAGTEPERFEWTEDEPESDALTCAGIYDTHGTLLAEDDEEVFWLETPDTDAEAEPKEETPDTEEEDDAVDDEEEDLEDELGI